MSDSRVPPWWSSGAEDLDDADPFEAHSAARGWGDPGDPSSSSADTDGAGTSGSTGQRPWEVPWEDWDDRDPPPPPGTQRSPVDDAFEALQALARFVASRRGRSSGARPHGRDQSCRACPWCIAMRSLDDARPEVVDHLDEAVRHLVAAARAWVEMADSGGQWQRIPLDDEDDGGATRG